MLKKKKIDRNKIPFDSNDDVDVRKSFVSSIGNPNVGTSESKLFVLISSTVVFIPSNAGTNWISAALDVDD